MKQDMIKKGLNLIENAGLVIILIATLVAITQEVWVIIQAREVRLSDLLLLFIFLEVVALVGIYYESHRLPVRYPLYIAIIALARYIILDSKDLVPWGLVAVSVTILVLTISVFLLRIGHSRFPYKEGD
ncbi:MAG: phosphate-starvation-inducible PsiE family protein [Pseudomonadota bacterium]